MSINTNVTFNEKGQYISYTSPYAKTKKGTSLQKTKGVKKIKNSDGEVDYIRINRIVSDMKAVLDSFNVYSCDYEGYLKAKSEFDEIAVQYIYEDSDFENIYNLDMIVKAMDNIIPIFDCDGNFLEKSVAMMGESGSGKTTLAKQLIGSTGTEFPATSQANTTVGSLYVYYDSTAKSFKCCIALVSKAQLKDRIRNSMIKAITKSLRDAANDEEVKKYIYDNIILTPDRKCKLGYILKKKDLDALNGEGTLRLFDKLWNTFLSNNDSINKKQFYDFKLVTDSTMLVEFEVFLEELLSQEDSNELYQLYEKIEQVVFNKIAELVANIIDNTFNGDFSIIKNEHIEISIMDENSVFKLDTERKEQDWDRWEKECNSVYPKMISIECFCDESEYANSFFRKLEKISCANQNKMSLFPLIEEMRILGNFKPDWLSANHEELKNYILIDTEGIGHDMRSGEVSMELRTLLEKCDLVLFSQNASSQLNEKFANALSVLIYTAAIKKTMFLFNRMEKFEEKYDFEEKLNFIMEGINNALVKIVADEESNDQKVVVGSESTFIKQVAQSSIYLEYLDEKLKDDKVLVLEKNKNVHRTLMEEAEKLEDGVGKESVKQAAKTFEISFDERSNPVLNLRKMFSTICAKTSENDKAETSGILRPIYRADKLTNELNAAIQEFVGEFILRVNSNPWQTVKAFNSRIANNFGFREWRELKPESELIAKIQTHLMSFLINPENVDNMNKDELIDYIYMLFNKKFNKAFREQAQRLVYEELKERCWLPMFQENGQGSTFTRRDNIVKEVTVKFCDTKNGNILYVGIRKLLFDNEEMRDIKCEYI